MKTSQQNSRERYKNYNPERLKNALNEIKPGKSLLKISKKFNIPRSTLQHRIKKQNFATSLESHNRLLSENEENSVSKYISWMAERNFPVTRKVLMITVQGILKKNKFQFDSSKIPSKKWCQRFMKRHQLAGKTPKQSDEGHSQLKPDCVDSFFSILESLFEKHDFINKPERIYNIDETGFSKQTNLQAPVIVPIGTKAISRPVFTNDHVTSVHTVSASGQTIAPMIIFTRNVPRSIKNMEPNGWLYRSTKSGFINTELFIEWFKEIFLKSIPAERPVVLILDAHSTHVSLEFAEIAKENQVEVVSLPSKTTHVLQPLDQLFAPLKEIFASTSLSLKYVNGTILTNQSKFPSLLQISMDKAWSPYTVKLAFQRTGIFPLAKEAVQWAIPKKKKNKSTLYRDVEIETTPCEECGKVEPCSLCFKKVAGRDNILVREGLVDVNLYDICVPPEGVISDLQHSTNDQDNNTSTCNARNYWQKSHLLTDDNVITERTNRQNTSNSNRTYENNDPDRPNNPPHKRKQKKNKSNMNESHGETLQTNEDMPNIHPPKRVRKIIKRKKHTHSPTDDDSEMNGENSRDTRSMSLEESQTLHVHTPGTSTSNYSSRNTTKTTEKSFRRSSRKLSRHNYAQMHEGVLISEVENEQFNSNTKSDTALCPECKLGYEEGDTELGVFWLGCDFCPRWWHEHCLPSEYQAIANMSCMDPTVQFRCPACPQDKLCSVCFITGTNDIEFAKCENCLVFYHLECLPDEHFIEYKTYVDLKKKWFCSRCMVEQ